MVLVSSGSRVISAKLFKSVNLKGINFLYKALLDTNISYPHVLFPEKL